MSAQTIDEKLGNAMNAADWFMLDSIYNTTPKDSINPFIEVFSRCLIGNRLNRTDISIPAFQELLNSQTLDISTLVSSTHMFGIDLSREGYNAEAASMIKSIVNQTKQHLDSTTVDGLIASANRYAALAEYKPYDIVFQDGDIATIPFSIVPVGPKDKEAVLIHLQRSSINGIDADITFDTGAGANIISHEIADKYNLVPLAGTMQTVAGVGRRDGYIAMAKEIKIGNITVKDVPFIVISFSTDNDEADKYIDCFNIVIGSELMLQLKDLTIDFANRQIIIPTQAPTKTDAKPNMCFSAGMNLLTKGLVNNIPTTMCIDSGDASFGSLNSSFYEINKEHVEQVGRRDTIRSAGMGGVTITSGYYVPDLPITIAGTTVLPLELVVRTSPDKTAISQEANIGLKTLMLFGRIRFNLVDFVLTTYPYTNSLSVATVTQGYNAPFFKLSKTLDKPTILQTLGFIGLGIARSLINPNAPTNPDL